MRKLEKPGQIKKGATIVLSFNGEGQVHKAERILRSGKSDEEIILNKKRNLYFITEMAIEGTSWAKEVKFSNPQ